MFSAALPTIAKRQKQLKCPSADNGINKMWSIQTVINIGGSDHTTVIAKFRLKLKRVGKTTRPFR